jgi:WYL_2, Sm-like SH3 beta-barrel fold
MHGKSKKERTDMNTSPHAFSTPEGRAWMVSLLRKGPVEIVFTKKDGTERTMKCTLQEGVVVPHEKTTERVKESNPNIVAVWDLEKSAWRSFKLDSILSYTFAV